MITSYLEPVVTGAIGNPDELVLGDDGLTVTVGGSVPCDEPVTDFDRIELVYGDDGDVVVVCGPDDQRNFQWSRLLENAHMTTDLDCNWYVLKKIGRFIPIPDPLIGFDDPRLSDPREMLDGSVTNESVAEDAAIEQSKFLLNGDIPPQYLLGMPDDPVTTEDFITLVLGDDNNAVTVGGFPAQHDAVTTGAPGDPLELVTGDDGATVIVTGSTSGPTRLFAAPGDEVQYIAEKGLPNGYVPLDADRRMPFSMYPAGAPIGTLNSFTLNVVPSFMEATPSVITSGSHTIVVSWSNLEAFTWMGNTSGGGDPPKFRSTPFYPSMIPKLSTTKIVSGVFTPDQMPVAVGVNHPDHRSGVLPDPGLTGAPDDYLARDMTYKTMRPEPSYEPMAPNPSITILYFTGDDAAISITDQLPDASLFYRINHAGTFLPSTGIMFVPKGSMIESYAAKIGYTNSDVVSFFVPLIP